MLKTDLAKTLKLFTEYITQQVHSVVKNMLKNNLLAQTLKLLSRKSGSIRSLHPNVFFLEPLLESIKIYEEKVEVYMQGLY